MSNVAYVRNNAGTLKFMMDNGNSAGLCIQAAQGRVGINYTTPSTNLHVQGDCLISDTLTTRNLALAAGGTVTGLARSATVDTTVASNITVGSLPSSVIPPTGVVPGSYGRADAAVAFTVGADGRLTSAANVPLSTWDASNVAGLAASATVDTTQASNITSGHIPASIIPETGIVAGVYPPAGTSNAMPQMKVQSDGRISSASNVPISIVASQVVGLEPWATLSGNLATNAPPTLYGLRVLPNGTSVASIAGSASITQDTAATGLLVQGPLDVRSNATFSAPVTLTGGATTTHLSASGALSVGSLVGPLQFDSNVTFTGPVTMAGGATLSQLTVTGPTTFDRLSIAGKLVGSGTAGAVVVSSNATFTGPVAMTGGATLSNLTVTQAATVGSLFVTGNLSGPFAISCNATFLGPVAMTSNLTLATLSVTSQASIAGSLTVGDPSAPWTIKHLNTTASSLTLASNVTLNSTLLVGSDATFLGPINATSGPTTLSNLTVTQSTLLASTSNTGLLFVGGDFQVQGSGSVAQLSGGVSATSLSGGCITDSTTTTSSQVAASATAIQGVATIASAAVSRSGGTGGTGGSMTGPLFAPSLSSCNVFAAALSGGAITDSWTTTSSQVAASATAVSNVAAQASNMMMRTGGLMTGPLTVSGLLMASNVQILGTTTTINSHEILTSNIWVSNVGTGPALSVSQVEGGMFGVQPVATFYSGPNLALLIDNSGNVALGKPSVTSGATLDVSGNVVVSGTLTAPTIIGGIATGLMGTPSISVGAIAASGPSSFAGPVGVGKAASLVPLDISGSIAVSGQASFASNLSVAGQLSTSNPMFWGTVTAPMANLGSILVPAKGQVGIGVDLGIRDGVEYTVQPFPPVFPTQIDATSGYVSGQVYGNGTYYITTSDTRSAHFLEGVGKYSILGYGVYNDSGSKNGVYTGSSTTTYNNNTATYAGEWVQYQLPVAIYLQYITYLPFNSNDVTAPKKFAMFGSNDGSNWTLISQQTTTLSMFTSGQSTTFNMPSTTAYTYFRFVINATTSGYTITYGCVLFGSTLVSTATASRFALDVSGSVNVRGPLVVSGNFVYSSDGSSGAYFNPITKKFNRTFAGWTFDEEGGICTPIGRSRRPYGPTGANQTWIAPTTGYIYVKLWGAGGGGGSQGNWAAGGPGGGGGHARGLIPVTAGMTYTIVVGIGGQTNYPGGIAPSYGGGGGLVNVFNVYAGQGGGYCGIFQGSVTQSNALLIAGGGGGGSSSRFMVGNWGGAGGGQSGEQGNSAYQNTASFGGAPGTQTAGGASNTTLSAQPCGPGYALTGGYTNSLGGAGGGGYFGGAGGGYTEGNIAAGNPGTMGGGGGGSGYIASSVIFGATFTGRQQHPAFSWDPDLSPLTDPFNTSAKYGYGGECAYNAYNAYTGVRGGCGYCVLYYDPYNFNDGTTAARAATSGYALYMANPYLPNGYYWIKSAVMPNALLMYVDIANGGFDFYPISGGVSVNSAGQPHDGTPLGLDLAIPRSQNHWSAIYAYVHTILGSTYATWFAAMPIFRNTCTIGTQNYSSSGANLAMFDPRWGMNVSGYVGAPDWMCADGGLWYLRDVPFAEPNGNYTYNTFLGGYGDTALTTYGAPGWDDGNGYFTGTNYIVSTNFAGSTLATTYTFYDGSTSDRAAPSAMYIKTATGTSTNGVYWINLPTVGATQVYCIMDTAVNGGGWMMAMKATRGTTFSFASGYWKDPTTTLNQTDTTRNDGDAKYNSFNYFLSKDLLALWPDITTVGGSLSLPSYGCWCWMANNYNGGTKQALTSIFTTAVNLSLGSYVIPTGNQFSTEGGNNFYGINFTLNAASSVRWGLAFNNEADWLSDDVTGGIGLQNIGGAVYNYSAGDAGSPGINRSARVEMYVR